MSDRRCEIYTLDDRRADVSAKCIDIQDGKKVVFSGRGDGKKEMLRKKYHVVRKKYHVVRKIFYVASIFGGVASRKNRPRVKNFPRLGHKAGKGTRLFGSLS